MPNSDWENLSLSSAPILYPMFIFIFYNKFLRVEIAILTNNWYIDPNR